MKFTILQCLLNEEVIFMNQEEINAKYNLFNIPKEFIPDYKNPYDFSRDLQKCTLLKSEDIRYSCDSILINQNYSAK